jgi:hypothetical protein
LAVVDPWWDLVNVSQTHFVTGCIYHYQYVYILHSTCIVDPEGEVNAERLEEHLNKDDPAPVIGAEVS